MIAHTPGPWYCDADGIIRSSAVDQTIATTLYGFKPVDIMQADLVFIVRACNAHDELLAALRELHEAAADAKVFHIGDLPARNRLIDAYTAAGAALAKAGA